MLKKTEETQKLIFKEFRRVITRAFATGIE